MVLLYVNIVILLFSLSYIIYIKYNVSKDKRNISDLQAQKSQTTVQTNIEEESAEVNEPEETPEPTKEPTILPEYEKLYNQNNDLYGWIKIEGTLIDYPVMYTPDYEDTNFYLRKNFQKEYSNLGTPFIDGRCTEDSENLIIYGHNFEHDDTMFGPLEQYKQEEFYEQHKYINFDTLYEKTTYEVIAVSKAVIYYDQVPEDEYLFYEHVELDSKEAFDDYIANMKENSYYDIEASAEYGDQIITLCTCDYWGKNARLLVVAKKCN